MLCGKFQVIEFKLQRRLLKDFTICRRVSNFCHVTITMYTNFRFPRPMGFHMKFAFDGSDGFGDL